MVWGRLGMDGQSVRGLSPLSAADGSVGRIQREVHVQPIRLAGRFVRDICVALEAHVPKLLSADYALAVHGHPTGEVP